MQPGTQLGPYQIEAPLGAGGMGEVYRARDTRLGRLVAIKVLPPGRLADAERKRRFLQEARAASALNHPNIVVLHDISEQAGVDFMVMELVPGESLEKRIPREGLEAAEVVHYAVQIASALTAAHAAGITHRDLKPGNIMITPQAHVKVLDFGLAKLADPIPGERGDETLTMGLLTEPGLIMGTIGYMSPEQVRGEKVDHRSDLFSLGCVLYKMATGRGPFTRSTAQDSLAAILRDQPPIPLHAGEPLPEALAGVIERCLQKNRERRFTSAQEIGAALSGTESTVRIAVPVSRRKAAMAAGGALVVAAGAAGAWWRWGGFAPVDSLAVLPMENATGDAGNDYLADGIAEGVINRLSQTNLKVTSRARAFKMRARDPQEAGKELGVGAVVSARLTKQGNDLVVQAELINLVDGTQIWGDRFVRSAADLQSIDAQIAARVSENLRLRLSQSQTAEVSRSGTTNAAARDLYLRGNYQWNKLTPGGLQQAVDYFTQATELDPEYAQAYAGLARAWTLLAVEWQQSPKEIMPRAKRAAEQALRLNPNASEAHAALGIYDIFYGWDFPAARVSFTRALELNPKDTDALHFYSHYQEAVGDTEGAIQTMRQAVELDPYSTLLGCEHGFALYFAQRYPEAIETLRKTLAGEPGYVVAVVNLAASLERSGRPDEAIAELRKADQNADWIQAELACAHAVAGREGEARRILDNLQRSRVLLSPVLVAMVYAELGETDQVLRWLDRAYRDRSSDLIWLNVDPKFQRIRNDPRFQEIVGRMKLG